VTYADLNWTPTHYKLRSLASSMAFADNTWDEDLLYKVTGELSLNMGDKWQGDIPDHDIARREAAQTLQAMAWDSTCPVNNEASHLYARYFEEAR
jgi:hypothetical protein